MARIRSLKPSFWTDEKVIGLSRDARLLCIGMISHADDEGRLLATVTKLAGDIFPADDLKPGQVLKWRDEIAHSGLIRVYRVGSVEYAHFPHWKKHQRISKPQPSVLPGPDRAAPEAQNGSTPKRGTRRGTPPRPGASLARGGAHVTETGERREEEENPSPQPPPAPTAPPTPEPGEERGEGEGHDVEELAVRSLVDEVRALRPGWGSDSIRRVLDRSDVRERPWPVVAVAMLAVAKDPASQSPGRLSADGPWWSLGLASNRVQAPPKCDQCNPFRRLEDTEGADLGPCPTCHPSIASGASR